MKLDNLKPLCNMAGFEPKNCKLQVKCLTPEPSNLGRRLAITK